MIYHFTDHTLFQQALEADEYTHPSLIAEGFIHCSTRAQFRDTITLHFADATEIVVLHIVERRIKDLVKLEPAPARPEAGPFPHIYGAIPLEAIEDVSILTRDAAGGWDWQDVPGI